MQQRLDRFRGSPEGQEWMRHRRNLPVYAIKDALLAAVATADVIVVGGDTGCGKTTQVQPPDAPATGTRRHCAIGMCNRHCAIGIGDHPGTPHSLIYNHSLYLFRLRGLPSVRARIIACQTPAALCAMGGFRRVRLFRAQARGTTRGLLHSAQAACWILFCPSLKIKQVAVHRQL